MQTEPVAFFSPERLDEPETQNERAAMLAELLSRVYHVTSEDPVNFSILMLRVCHGKTFREIKEEVGFRGADEKVRKRFDRMSRYLFDDEEPLPRPEPRFVTAATAAEVKRRAPKPQWYDHLSDDARNAVRAYFCRRT